jgi:hypothetical protein
MRRWIDRLRGAPTMVPQGPPPPPPLSELERDRWRRFVVECNAKLREQPSSEKLKFYAQRIHQAVVYERLSLEEFLRRDPPPWLGG